MTKVEELERQIKRHKALYYQGRAEISDEAFDLLEEELRKIDPENAALKMVGTATFSSKKVKHEKKMLSLEKTYVLEDLINWINNREVVVTPKIDGVSCSLIYENGILKIAKTRGDGEFGEEISEKIAWIGNIPNKVKIDCEVRGEIFCRMEQFISLVEEMKKLDLDPPSSQRNIVAGLISRKDHIELCQNLEFLAFDLITEQQNIVRERDKYNKLTKIGFEIPPFQVVKNKNEIEAELEEVKSMMENGDMLIDGMVITLDDLKLHNELGETSHHPKYKIAYKFVGQSKETKIKKINWYTSKNGILTPVAEVEPVELSGATVTNVTLHNFGVVKQFNLKKGDTIEIVRSGEVIPKFLSVKVSSKGTMLVPSECPSCGKQVFEEEIRLVCKNKECPDRIKEGILDFINKIGIYDLSEKRLQEMIKKRLVKEIPDLYRLTKADLLGLDKTKEKLAEKLFQNIQVTKQTTMVKLLGSLGISGAAINRCEKIAHAGFDTIDKISSASVEDLLRVEGLAEKSATEFVNSFKEKLPIIEKLLALGFEIEKSEKNDLLGGKVFVITGELSVKRKDFEDLVRKNGGVISSSVSKNTSFLISNENDSGSSKFIKAQKLKVPVITEEDFNEMLKKHE